MSRTPLFAAVKKALAVASHENGVVWPRTSALTRRQLLRLSAAAAGAPALAPVLDRRAYAKKPGPSSIAIVGGGVAGLTAASFAAARREAGSVRSRQPLGRTHVHPIRLL